MKNLILSIALLMSIKAAAGVPYCNIAQLNPDGTPTANATVKEFQKIEKLILKTPNGDAQLSAIWNDSFDFYQMTLTVNGIEVNSVIEKPATSGMLNLWIDKSQGYTTQCRFELE